MSQPIDLTAVTVVIKAHGAIDISCILFIKFHQESHSGSRGIALRCEGKNLKTTEPVKRMNGVCVDDENAVKVERYRFCESTRRKPKAAHFWII